VSLVFTYKEGRPILDVAKETTGLSEKELRKLLDTAGLAKGGFMVLPAAAAEMLSSPSPHMRGVADGPSPDNP
jgi:hypothetical protein